MNTSLKHNLRLILLLLADAVLIVLEGCVLWDCWKVSGTTMFRYYTQDSNILAFLVSLISFPITLWALVSGKRRPRFLKSLRLVAASGLMVTFLVSALVLTPLNSGLHLKRYLMEFKAMMLEPPILYFHTLCPLMMFFAFLLLEDDDLLPRIQSTFILPPTILYGAVTLYKNYTFAYFGPYAFFRVHNQPPGATILWCAAILLGAWLISLGILEWSRLLCRKRRPFISADKAL